MSLPAPSSRPGPVPSGLLPTLDEILGHARDSGLRVETTVGQWGVRLLHFTGPGLPSGGITRRGLADAEAWVSGYAAGVQRDRPSGEAPEGSRTHKETLP